MVERVAAECGRQVVKWGVQHRPSGGGSPIDIEAAERATALTDRLHQTGGLTWKAILDEEVREAFAETEDRDPEALVTELLQSAAVAVSAAVDIERRHGL